MRNCDTQGGIFKIAQKFNYGKQDILNQKCVLNGEGKQSTNSDGKSKTQIV